MKKINPEDLICMDDVAKESFRVSLAYARADNLLFGEKIYRPGAKLYLHRSLATIVQTAADMAHHSHGLRFILYDGLRTTDAQEKMLRTERVRQNPHWLEEPRLLSPPGAGGHPRGMAIDIGLEGPDGALLDMGTPFDFLAQNASAPHNPAHREHPHLTPQQRENRGILDSCMSRAAKALNTPLLPLPEEWWDFRLIPGFFNTFAPLSDADLPPVMRLIEQDY